MLGHVLDREGQIDGRSDSSLTATGEGNASLQQEGKDGQLIRRHDEPEELVRCVMRRDSSTQKLMRAQANQGSTNPKAAGVCFCGRRWWAWLAWVALVVEQGCSTISCPGCPGTELRAGAVSGRALGWLQGLFSRVHAGPSGACASLRGYLTGRRSGRLPGQRVPSRLSPAASPSVYLFPSLVSPAI